MEKIPIEYLEVSKQNVRTDLISEIGDDESTIEELASSIKEHGLINPISVRKRRENKYDIFAGQRRYLAMKRLGWKTIPCIISDIDDDTAMTRSLIENFHRQNNTYEEKVKAFKDLYEKHCDKNEEKLSKLVGLKQGTIKR